MTETAYQDIWTSLIADARSKSSGMIVRRVGPVAGQATLLAVDCASGRRWFLAELDASTGDLDGLPNWREVGLRLVDHTATHRKAIGLELASSDFVDIFSALCRDLVEALAGVEETGKRLQAVRNRLRKWSQFMREHGRSGLSEERVRGLFAELWMLSSHLFERMSALDAVRSWKGPDADAHDFRRLGHAIEVKATGTSTPAEVYISNEEQLDDTGIESLWLLVAFLDDSGDRGLSLPDLIDQVRGKLASDTTASDTFEGKLVRAGYIDEAAYQYPRRYEVTEEAAFRVVDPFPRLIKPPQGIRAVKYRLGLSHVQQWRVPVADALSSFCPGNG